MAIVVTDEAVRAALNAPVGADRPLDGYADWAIKEMRDSLTAALAHLVGDSVTPRTCKVCGCTDAEACPGGCSWAQPAICSTCANRQLLLDEQRLATMRAQQSAAEQQADLVAKARVLADEQLEVAKMQRENLAGATWRLAVDCAARDAGSPTETDGAHERIQADAEWYAHLLGTPPVVF